MLESWMECIGKVNLVPQVSGSVRRDQVCDFSHQVFKPRKGWGVGNAGVGHRSGLQFTDSNKKPHQKSSCINDLGSFSLQNLTIKIMNLCPAYLVICSFCLECRGRESGSKRIFIFFCFDFNFLWFTFFRTLFLSLSSYKTHSVFLLSIWVSTTK